MKKTTPPTRKRKPLKDVSQPATSPSGDNNAALNVILGVVVIGLVLLIGWFAYLLMKPADPDTDTTSNQNINTNENTNLQNTNTVTKNNNSNKNSNANALANENENTNANDNGNENTNTANTNEDDAGLVEPDPDKDTVTLYFPTSSDSCGTVTAVEREMELGDDAYGETMIAAMAGPTSEEDGYVDGVPSTVGLRLVQYTSDGPLVTVTEGYNDLDDCTKQTVDATLIETANAMFDLPEGTTGEVTTEDPAEEDVAALLEGEDDSTNTNSTTNTNSNSNTNKNTNE